LRSRISAGAEVFGAALDGGAPVAVALDVGRTTGLPVATVVNGVCGLTFVVEAPAPDALAGGAGATTVPCLFVLAGLHQALALVEEALRHGDVLPRRLLCMRRRAHTQRDTDDGEHAACRKTRTLHRSVQAMRLDAC
jgi:hypothetical protein